MPRYCEEFKADGVEKVMPPNARDVADAHPQFRNARAQAQVLNAGGIDGTGFAERPQAGRPEPPPLPAPRGRPRAQSRVTSRVPRRQRSPDRTPRLRGRRGKMRNLLY